ncbi:hypothetical protein HUJ04_007953 [Dendroctonus ponderosae]|uniref:Bifunctional coenzyme A synthase n=1 Tax=Dendroctonus ponderosae TaxID=77166 RepID=A0AAR5QDV5_DENPD|nr:hypothetical protein HUJ04_007953 [Dendroctonus ponderosae]
MLAKTGLLIVSNPKHINKLLSNVKETVKHTLYIQLLTALNEPLGSFYSHMFNTPPKLSRTIFGIYSQATRHCNNLDVRVLLTGVKSNVPQIGTRNPIDVVIFDRKYSKADIDNFMKCKLTNVSKQHRVLTVDCENVEDPEVQDDSADDQVYKHACLGGTFDRLHAAHKVLLSYAILHASEKVTVGITEENMVHSKLLWELIQDVDTRIANVEQFVMDVCPEISYNICKISDPFGPAVVDPTMDVIVVSVETVRGGEKINEIRKQKSLAELVIVPIPFIDEPDPQAREETKVSSSNQRLRLLGTLLNPLEKKNIPNKPYVIGLTGGIASGKSGVTSHLKNMGVPIIDCDKIGHQVYQKNAACYQEVISQFGKEILNSDGEIDRRVLGNLVFEKPAELTKLTDIVWPAIKDEVQRIIRKSEARVVCVEAAILTKAGWDAFCHEVWTTFVPEKEAIERLKTRNNLTEEQAKSRMAAQPSNKENIQQANVVFCPLWEVEYTKMQVEKAWDLLQIRLSAL